MTSHTESLAQSLREETGNAHFYLYLRALDRLAGQKLDSPSSDAEGSLAELRAVTNTILSELGFAAGSVNIWDEGLLEVCRHKPEQNSISIGSDPTNGFGRMKHPTSLFAKEHDRSQEMPSQKIMGERRRHL